MKMGRGIRNPQFSKRRQAGANGWWGLVLLGGFKQIGEPMRWSSGICNVVNCFEVVTNPLV